MPKVPKKNNFTLIEVLVVIAIIGVLASLLLPVLGKARKSAKTTLSINNLKQIHLSVMLYADDNNGILCTSDKTPHPKGSNADWPRMIYEHMFGMFSLNPSDATDEMNNDSKYNTMMYCPLLLGERDPIKNKPGGRSAYSMNRYFGKAGNDFTLNNLSGKTNK